MHGAVESDCCATTCIGERQATCVGELWQAGCLQNRRAKEDLRQRDPHNVATCLIIVLAVCMAPIHTLYAMIRFALQLWLRRRAYAL